MKIDKSIEKFVETYDNEMMSYIDNLNNERYLSLTDSKITLSDIKESFDKFNNYLEGYKSYRIENTKTNNTKESPRDVVCESVNTFIEKELFNPIDIKYDQINDYVKSFIEGINHTISNIENIKSEMMSNDVQLEYVGDVNNFCDAFVEKLEKHFGESMDKILLSSGYTTKKNLEKVGTQKKENHIFV